jgi:hypothetical protein
VFDTFAGLPVHALVLHAAVVGAPLMSVVTVVVAARPAWRARLGWAVVVADALLLALVWVTAESGEALQDRLGGQVADEHGDLGESLPYFAAGLLAAAVLSALVGRRRGLGVVAVAATLVAAGALTTWTVLTGHSGSEAVWADVVGSTG